MKRGWVFLGLVFVILPIVHLNHPHISFQLFGDRVDLHLGIYTLILLYTALAIGLNFSIGFIGMLDLGFAAFIGIGGYAFAILSVTYGWPVWVAVPSAAVAGGALRAALGATCLRLRGDYLAIVTLGFGEIFVTVVRNDPWGMTAGPNGIPLSLLRSAQSAEARYWIAFVVAALVVVGTYRLKFSRYGRAFEAIREDEIAAEAMGVPVFRCKLIAYTIGGAIAGAIGALLAIEVGTAHPDNYDFYESARVVAMVVLGGAGSIFGSAFGAIFFILLLEIFRPLSEYRLLIFGAAMILVMILRPGGLLRMERMRRSSC